MRRMLCVLCLLMLFCGVCPAHAEAIEFSDMDLPALYELREAVNARISALEQGEGHAIYGSGTYQVGRDIPAGDYLLTENEDAMFASVIVREDNGENTNLICHNIINHQCVVHLRAGTTLTLSEASACPIAQANPNTDGVVGEGGYLVGTMLPAGRYDVIPLEKAPLTSYSVYSGVLGTNAQPIIFDMPHGIVTIELNDGEYIELSGCGLAPSAGLGAMEETP